MILFNCHNDTGSGTKGITTLSTSAIIVYLTIQKPFIVLLNHGQNEIRLYWNR